MYKLLLATDRPEVAKAFDQIAWESMGFRAPRRADTAQAAIDCMQAHHIDAIAYELADDESRILTDYLIQSKPILPIFQASESVPELESSLQMLRSLLTKLHADYSNDGIGIRDMLQICRHDFLRDLVGGAPMSPACIRAQLKLLRSRMDPEVPCVLVDFALPEGDRYISERWHYGHKRLEVALRNFLGAELDGMRMLVCVLPDERVRLLCCPMVGASVAPESMTAEVADHLNTALSDIHTYLDMDLSVTSIRVVDNLDAVAANGTAS